MGLQLCLWLSVVGGPEDEQYESYRVLQADMNEDDIDIDRDYTPDPRYVRGSSGEHFLHWKLNAISIVFCLINTM